ncbi:MAG: ATP-binding protein, partial [Thermoguttaceae bacterium]|nr:ATP-binding protein [Thermoguttaceae bacterium]
MIIKRDRYLTALINRMHNGLVKVVTGIRRSGKSFLIFNLFQSYLKENGVDGGHIIALELDDRRNREYRDPDALLHYIDSRMTDGGEYYILLDEVQEAEHFEEVLNSLLHLPNADVYVTGSNSKFLSKDVVTEFRGRGDEVHIFPLSFQEFMQVFPGDVYHGWADYITYGGLPYVAAVKTEEQKTRYLTNLFSEVYIRDVVERYRIEKTQELNDLIDVLASSIGALTNPAKIEATFKSVMKSSLTAYTVRQYIERLEEAFIISAARRYDVKGRKHIGSPMKYYFEDHGLRNARLGFRQVEEPHLMENVIYNELRLRGYLDDVGVVDERRTSNGVSERKRYEIDFVANQGSKRYY